jgi:hypothetical protein
VVIFEKPSSEKEGEVVKICEKCFFEIQEKAASNASLQASTPEIESTPSGSG